MKAKNFLTLKMQTNLISRFSTFCRVLPKWTFVHNHHVHIWRNIWNFAHLLSTVISPEWRHFGDLGHTAKKQKRERFCATFILSSGVVKWRAASFNSRFKLGPISNDYFGENGQILPIKATFSIENQPSRPVTLWKRESLTISRKNEEISRFKKAKALSDDL